MSNENLPGQVIKRPLLTEKGTMLGESCNQILFEVAIDANKIAIRQAIEALYDVRVTSVRTQRRRGKIKRVGRSVGLRPRSKKAFVTLAEGSNIDFFSAA